MATVTCIDETGIGNKTNEFHLDLNEQQIPLRELLKHRVYEEVRAFNLAQPEHFRGLIQPTDTEQELNGYRLRKRRQLSWRAQYDRAIEAFRQRGFIVLVNQTQVDDLEAQIDLQVGAEVTFLKLVPLVGG